MHDKNLINEKDSSKMKYLILFISVVVIIISCSKEKTNGIPITPIVSTPKPIYDTFNLRVAVGNWHLDPWTLLDGDSTYFTVLPRFSTLPGLTGRADTIKTENIILVKIKMGSTVLQVNTSNSSRPFFYNISNAPIGGPNNTIMIHWWDARPDFYLADSVYLQLKFLK